MNKDFPIFDDKSSPGPERGLYLSKKFDDRSSNNRSSPSTTIITFGLSKEDE